MFPSILTLPVMNAVTGFASRLARRHRGLVALRDRGVDVLDVADAHVDLAVGDRSSSSARRRRRFGDDLLDARAAEVPAAFANSSPVLRPPSQPLGPLLREELHGSRSAPFRAPEPPSLATTRRIGRADRREQLGRGEMRVVGQEPHRPASPSTCTVLMLVFGGQEEHLLLPDAEDRADVRVDHAAVAHDPHVAVGMGLRLPSTAATTRSLKRLDRLRVRARGRTRDPGAGFAPASRGARRRSSSNSLNSQSPPCHSTRSSA